MSVYSEIINIFRLSFQHTVEHCIIHFVALEVIMELNKIYLESLNDDKNHEILHYKPKVVIKGNSIKLKGRSCFHKVARIVYKVLRSLYVSVIFYFVPFAVILANF